MLCLYKGIMFYALGSITYGYRMDSSLHSLYGAMDIEIHPILTDPSF